MKTKLKSIITQYLLISLGSAVYAAAVSLFLDPNEIIPGGFTGVAMIIGYFVPGVQTGTMVFLLNVPIVILGIFRFGFKFLSSTIYSVALSSILMNLLAPVGPLTRDPLLACIAGGCLVAIGLHLVLTQGATTGGTDIIVKLLRTKFRGISAGKMFIMVDGMVVLCAALVTRNVDSGLYAAMCIITLSVVMDTILNGSNEAKMILLISDKYEEVTKRLMTEIDAGATLLDGTGAYSGKEKKVLLCVVKKTMITRALKIIKAVDDQSFAIVTTANEVFGEGYKLHGGEGENI